MAKKLRWVPLLFSIIILAITLRSYHINETFQFNFDQERDAWVMKRLIIDHKPVLIGPKAGETDFYLGPLYYYLLLPFYYLFNLDPLGSRFLTYLIVFLNTTLFYFVGRSLFSQKIGFIAAFIYSVSAYLINFERIVWNPILIIPLVMVNLFSLSNFLKGSNRNLLLSFFSSGFLFHIHATAILVLIFNLLILFLKRSVLTRRHFFIGGLIFSFFFLPQIAFELRHQFLNTKAIINFFLFTKQVQSFDPFTKFFDMVIIAIQTLKSMVILSGNWIIDVFLFLLIFKIYTKFFYQKLNLKDAADLNLFFIGFSVLGFSFFRMHIPDYYLMLIIPSFLFVFSSWIAEYLKSSNKKILFILISAFVIFANIYQIGGLKGEFSLKNKRLAVDYIQKNASDTPVKIYFATKLIFDSGFRYLLDRKNIPILEEKNPSLSDFIIISPLNFGDYKQEVIFGQIGIIKND